MEVVQLNNALEKVGELPPNGRYRVCLKNNSMFIGIKKIEVMPAPNYMALLYLNDEAVVFVPAEEILWLATDVEVMAGSVGSIGQPAGRA